MILGLALAVAPAHAQACVCARNVALPSGNVARPGEGVFTLDYGASVSGVTDGWRGAVIDRGGDSMAGMFMAPHLVQNAALGASIGLPKGFAASATVPYQVTTHLGDSAMPGDVDAHALADVDVTGRYGHLDAAKRAFVGGSAGVTLPTGEVVPDSPVRSGRGVVGATLGASAGYKLGPKLGIAASLGGATGFGADASGYAIGPAANLAAGARWSPRENGALNFSGFALGRFQGEDRSGDYVYTNTGYLTVDLALGASWNAWAHDLRSLTFALRAQAPVFQVVGDPTYAENFGATLGTTLVAF